MLVDINLPTLVIRYCCLFNLTRFMNQALPTCATAQDHIWCLQDLLLVILIAGICGELRIYVNISFCLKI